MKTYCDEKIIGLREAYEFYKTLDDEDKEKIPQQFVSELERHSKYDIGFILNYPSDIGNVKVSKEGIKLIGYMYLFI